MSITARPPFATRTDSTALFREADARTRLPRRQVPPETAKTITLRNVSYTYPGKDTPALDDISLTVHAEEEAGAVRQASIVSAGTTAGVRTSNASA
ncbi:hypothetical protein AB0F24_33165 [Streptomyces platensis]|uniref:hypothetical protein n=1 Tax=Streptomyces platensis TaxID=58346 RepID=UPI0033E127E2